MPNMMSWIHPSHFINMLWVVTFWKLLYLYLLNHEPLDIFPFNCETICWGLFRHIIMDLEIILLKILYFNLLKKLFGTTIKIIWVTYFIWLILRTNEKFIFSLEICDLLFFHITFYFMNIWHSTIHLVCGHFYFKN